MQIIWKTHVSINANYVIIYYIEVMTQYLPYGKKLSKGQKEKLARAYSNNSAITIRLNRNELQGNDELMLTKTQLKRIQKAMKNNKGADINISKTQIHKAFRHGGSLWSSLAGLSSKCLPMAILLAKKAAGPLATGALSGLASLGIDKIFGKGQKGGFLIPDSKINQLIKYKKYLTTKQKQDILNALQTGSGVQIKPTVKQQGNGFGTILASIGIPMLINALTGKGLQIDSNRSRRSIPVYVPPSTNSTKKDGGLVIPRDFRSEQFFGTWDQLNNPIGMGLKKKEEQKMEMVY